MSSVISEPSVADFTEIQMSLRNDYDQIRQTLCIYAVAFVARSLSVLAYFLLFTLPNPLNPAPSKMGPPLHITFIITIVILRDVVKITSGLRRLLKHRAAIDSEGITRTTLSLSDYREAVAKGLMQGFLLSTVGEALSQAGDGNIV